MNNDTVEFVLFDTDLTTALGILPAGSMKLDLILNEPGSGEVKIPLKSNAAGLVTSTMFASGKYRGGTRGGFFVENIGKDLVTSGENEAQWLSMSGRGALALLDDAMVDYDGTSATTRDLSGTRAGMLIDLIVEAQARGTLQNLDYDFTDTLDSDGNAWSDNDPLKWTVGTSLLDVARQISKIGIDFDIVPDGAGGFVLSAYKNGKGSDKSNKVYFRVGVNCEEVSSLEDGMGIRNALRIGYKAGYTAVSDSASITTYRRREKLLDARAAQTTAAALTYGGAELSMSKDPKKSITVKVYDGKGPRAFVDYALGDSITLDIKGVETTYRVRGMQLAWDGKKFADVFVELNSIILENEIRMAQDIGWLLDEWATARDANLLAVSYWAAIGGTDDVITSIKDFAWWGNKLVVIGSFTRIGGVNCSGIAVYDTDTGLWSDELYGQTGMPACVCVVGNDVYVGGYYLEKWDAGSGTWTKLIGQSSGTVNSIASDGTMLYICGSNTLWGFPPFSGFSFYSGVWAYDLSTLAWTDLGYPTGEKLLMVGSDLYYVCRANPPYNLRAVSKWNGSSWAQLGVDFDNTVLAIATDGLNIIVGGSFTGYISIWDGSTWTALNVSPGGTVLGLACFLTDIYAVGEFTSAGNRIAKYSGGAWYALENGLDATTNVIILKDDDVYAGGSFANAGTKSADKIAAYLSNFQALADYLENSSVNSFNMGAAIHNAVASAITDNDEVAFWEDVSKALRKITWANLWLAIKAKADLIYVALTGNQTVAGVKTFTSFPVTPSSAPTTDYEVANKKYVDDNGGSTGRELLTAARTYYVRTDGNNANTGLANTSGGAFLTIQKAVDTITTLDIAGFTVTVQIADGTYTTPVILKNVVGFSVPGNLVIKGNNTTPSNVIISTTAADAFSKVGDGSIWDILDLKITVATSGNGISSQNGANLRFANINFGSHPSSGVHLLAKSGGKLFCIGNYFVSGGGYIHVWADYGGLVDLSRRTITFSNSPAFSYFAIFSAVGILVAYEMIFTNGGTVTGTKYIGYLNSVVQTNAGITYFPGTTAGSLATGAQYA